MKLLVIAISLWGLTAFAANHPGRRHFVTSVRAGNTEVFIADPTISDLFNEFRSPKSEDRYLSGSSERTWISFRRTDARHWSHSERMLKTFAEKPADARPVGAIRNGNSEATLSGSLRFHMAYAGGGASWRPMPR